MRCETDTDLEAVGFLGDVSHENGGVGSEKACRERPPGALKRPADLIINRHCFCH